MVGTPPSATSRMNPPKPRATKSDPPKLTPREISERIADQLTALGTSIGMFDPVGGFIVLTNADEVGKAWSEVADANPRVKRVFERWFATSVYANAATATAMMALPLVTHWKLVPRGWFNPTSASVDQIEALVANGATIADLTRMWEEAERARREFMETVKNANETPASNGDAPDHFEAAEV